MRAHSITAALCAAALSALGPIDHARAQAGLCSDPAGFCGAKVPAGCLEKLGAGSLASSDELCGPAFAVYKDCISRAASVCPAADRAPDPDREDRARVAFEAVKDSGAAAELELVARLYGDTFWGKLAAERASALRAAGAPTEPAPEPTVSRAPAPEPMGEAAPAPARSEPAAPTEPAASAEPAPAAPTGPAPALVRAAQRALKDKCFYRGAVDGLWGPGSEAALTAFARRIGVRVGAPASAALDDAFVARIRAATVTDCRAPAPAPVATTRSRAPSPAPAPAPAADDPATLTATFVCRVGRGVSGKSARYLRGGDEYTLRLRGGRLQDTRASASVRWRSAQVGPDAITGVYVGTEWPTGAPFRISLGAAPRFSAEFSVRDRVTGTIRSAGDDDGDARNYEVTFSLVTETGGCIRK